MLRSQIWTRRVLFASSAGVIALLAGQAAFAADAPEAASSGGSAFVLEELVVTAEKRASNIQTVPAAVSAVQGERLQALALKSLSDYSQYVPGLVVTQNGSPGQSTVTLRGIAPLGPGATVGFYVDDTPLGSSGNFARATAFSLDLLPYDIERFEVLRGPQGTLYGAGTVGGLIKYVLTKAEVGQYSAQIGGEINSVSHSSGQGYALRAATNIPIVEGKFAVRLSAFNQEDQGYLDNARLGLKDVNGNRQYGGRIAATWLPIDNLTVNLNAMWYRQKSDDNNSVLLGGLTKQTDSAGAVLTGGTPTLGAYTGSHAFRQPFNKNIDYYSATVNWDLGAATATSATSWSRTRTEDVTDQTTNFGVYTTLFGLPAGVSVFDEHLALDKFTQELRLTSPSSDKFEWLVGAYYTRETSTIHQVVNVFDATYKPIAGAFSTIFNPQFAIADLPSIYREYSVFGDATLHLTPKFDVTGGVRWAHNSQDFRQISVLAAALGGATNQPGTSSDSVATWLLNARYQFTPHVMVYGRVATGYQPGGPNPSIGGKPSTPVGSDTLVNYEAGLKSTFLDGRALLNIAIFDIEWKDIQLTVRDPVTSTSNFANAGDAYSRGVEVEGSFAPIDGLRLGYDAAYTKARLTSLIPGSPNFILGEQLPGTPKWSGGATADYRWALSGDWEANVGGGFHYVGETFVGAPRAGANINTKNPAYTTVDLRAGVSNDRYRVNLFVRNAGDKRVYLQKSAITNPLTGVTSALDAVVLQPRTIGISLDATF